MGKPIFNEYRHREALDSALASDVADMLNSAISLRGEAFLAVSGGTTPLGFFRQLSEQVIDWSQVTITLVDERWVDSRSPQSNEQFLRTQLLVGLAARANFLPLKINVVSAHEGAVILETKFENMPSFDVVVLGMGTDGHTASLFPAANNADVYQGSDHVDSQNAVLSLRRESENYERVSLSLSRILKANTIKLHITGEDKKRVYEMALLSPKAKNTFPISLILQQSQTPVSVYWAH